MENNSSSKFKTFISNELTGWKTSEVIWLAIAFSVVLVGSIIKGTTTVSLIAGLVGVTCVVLSGKGKLSNFVFGFVQCFLMGIVALKSSLYMNGLMYLIYFVPMEVVGFVTWKKHINAESQEVIKRKMTWGTRFLWIAIIAAATAAFSYIMNLTNNQQPILDSFSAVCNIVAMIVAIKRYAEQWWIWLIVNVLHVILWFNDFNANGVNIAILLMSCVYLINSIIMLIKWTKEAKENEKICKIKV